MTRRDLLMTPLLSLLTGDRRLPSLLEQVRKRHGLPALGAAVLRPGAAPLVAVTGVRKQGDPTPAEPGDRFHIGSCTKAMTATLIATLVQEKKLRWDQTLPDLLPAFRPVIHEGLRQATLAQLLCHRAGITEDTAPRGKTLLDVHRLPGSVLERRRAYCELIVRQAPAAAPGTRHLYSNAGYTLAGHAAEVATGVAWETLMQDRLFRPLGIKTAGFGAAGSADRVAQPWPHRWERGRPVPVPPGPFGDNPPAIGPAGTAHLSLADWAHFAQAHLQGESGKAPLLAPETWRALHRDPTNGTYAFGWILAEREWAGGRAWTHAGSNTLNFAVAWLAPLKGWGVLVATNAGGGPTDRACDEVAAGCLDRFPP